MEKNLPESALTALCFKLNAGVRGYSVYRRIWRLSQARAALLIGWGLPALVFCCWPRHAGC